MPSQDLCFMAEEIYQDQCDTQNKISSGCHSPSRQSENLEINLSDANIDPELVYLTRDLAEILRSQPSLDLESNLSPTLEDRLAAAEQGKSLKSKECSSIILQNLPKSLDGQTQEISSFFESSCTKKQLNTRRNQKAKRKHRKLQKSKCMSESNDSKVSDSDVDHNSIGIPESLIKSNSPSDFREIIISNYLSRIKAQRYFDETGNVEKKIGRPSNCKPLNSQNINSWLTNLVKEKVLKFLVRDNSMTRTDLYCIEFFRIIKKCQAISLRNSRRKLLSKAEIYHARL